ncbi:hypothetical protein SBRCBS47491_002333 [Sporothrix bragantina]|uniref:Uncharacterized protein n=1 Tax=Sporothrix bragantina TaxID=671064 RepID=A0ABP0B5W0_9PEZI
MATTDSQTLTKSGLEVMMLNRERAANTFGHSSPLSGAIRAHPSTTSADAINAGVDPSLPLKRWLAFPAVDHCFLMQEGLLKMRLQGAEQWTAVREGQTLVIAAGQAFALEFASRYVRAITFTNGAGVEELVQTAGAPPKKFVLPEKVVPWAETSLHEAAGKLGVKLGEKVLILKQESMIRLVHHVNIHSTQDILITSGQPPLSVAELSLCFPQTRVLWFARSAAGWKEAYFRFHPGVPSSIPISIIDCLADHTRMQNLSNSFYDTGLAQLSVLHGVASQMHLFRHLHIVPSVFGLSGAQPGSGHRESMVPDEGDYRNMFKAYDGLHRLFKLGAGDGGVSCTTETPPTIMLMLDLLLMHFHCSIEQMELLAGREGFAEAKTVYASLQKRWLASRDSRQATWQAGQVLRRARTIPSESINDFHSLALYHASICLCVYSDYKALYV